MKSYWVSLIIQDKENSKPWLCAMSECCLSLDEAKKLIDQQRKNYRVLSAWVDTYYEEVKETVFHECYIK
jgi:hypothetical protein